MDKFTLLEIGVLGGRSVRMWKKYFPNAKIVGLDINPEVKVDPGIELVIGSQSDPQVLEEIASKFGPFRIVIDDGSHVVDHMLASFKYLWPYVEKNGWYVMEDMLCTYSNAHGTWPGMKYNEDIPSNNRSKINEFLVSLITNLDHFRGDTDEIRLYASQCMMRKISDALILQSNDDKPSLLEPELGTDGCIAQEI
jgi:cephalosporin hydroxylase